MFVQVFALPQRAASSDYAFLFELMDGQRVSPVFTHIDYPWHHIAPIRQHSAKEAFRHRCVAFGGQQEMRSAQESDNLPERLAFSETGLWLA